MHRTPFHNHHQAHDARFVDFFGWEMPILYRSIIDEHHQVRQHGGMFDVSHMGRLEVRGRHARKYLERILTRRISEMTPGSCRYSMICNERGGVLDDVIVYRFDDFWMLVVNASNREKVLNHMRQNVGDDVAEVNDVTFDTAMIALQGPAVMDYVGKLSSEVPTLKRYQFCLKNLLVMKLIISRTGYTGEDGVEVILPANSAQMAIKLLIKGVSAPTHEETGTKVTDLVGLGARDTLRMEAGMPLYGHELTQDIDPLSAGLKFAVSLDKGQDEKVPAFIGQQAIQKIADDGPPRQLIGLKLDGKRSPRQDMAVLKGDAEIGKVTSGCLSPTLGYPIAMALVQRDQTEVGQTVTLQMGSKQADAEVVKLPFYKRT